MVRPILKTIGLREGATTAAGLYILSIKGRTFFLADTSINTHMTSEKLAEIAIMAAEFAESMNVTPRVAMLSYSNFGSVKHPSAQLVLEATKLAKHRSPHLEIDGEMQVDTAVVPGLIEEDYPFCVLSGPANVLIFPDMQSGNIAYKLLQRLGGARVIGPVILGLNAPAHVMQRHAGVDEIFNMITVAVAQATLRSRRGTAE
jgi:malate dehydrogenase (oxaloacetate-decarboxylating)(NADP+)